MYIIDTNIAIYLRDVEATIVAKLDRLPLMPVISILSWVELEAGVYRDPANAERRRANLASLLDLVAVVGLEGEIVTAYGRIIASCGFSRSRIIDRLIAATALVHDLTLITINAADFRDIPDLRLEAWPAPTQ
jgi:predicted nucleic acid-binding protein